MWHRLLTQYLFSVLPQRGFCQGTDSHATMSTEVYIKLEEDQIWKPLQGLALSGSIRSLTSTPVALEELKLKYYLS